MFSLSVWSIQTDEVSHEPRSNASLFFFSVSDKAEHWSEASRRASAQICVCHQWETSAEHTEKAAAGAELSVTAADAPPRLTAPETALSADSGLTVSLCFHDYDLKLRP